MEKKQIITYSSIIAALVITLGALWALIITTVNNDTNIANGNSQSMSTNTSTTSYSATKEITTDETIKTGEYTSTNADENAILAKGTITANLSNITVNNAGRTGCSITGLPGHPVEDIWLSDITIHQQGGCQQIDIPSDEKEKDYPEATMWGPLPAKGFFVRHARHVTFRNIEITTTLPDGRPEFVKVDTE